MSKYQIPRKYPPTSATIAARVKEIASTRASTSSYDSYIVQPLYISDEEHAAAGHAPQFRAGSAGEQGQRGVRQAPAERGGAEAEPAGPGGRGLSSGEVNQQHGARHGFSMLHPKKSP